MSAELLASDGDDNELDWAEESDAPDPTPPDPGFETLLDYLKQARGFDFTGYKRASLTRRVCKRMEAVGIEGFPQYMDYLEVHPDEFGHLFNTILINVTTFFRDPQTWDVLAREFLPRLLASKDRTEPVRVWSAACASGEEAYTLAMLLAEALGRDGYRERVKIYATDLDEPALALARQASYTARDVTGVPPDLLAKYFEAVGDRYVFDKELRRAVIFGRHDLIQDAPISRIDLLACRNTLMYFNSEVQARVLARFHFALSEGGILALGRAEVLFTHASLFTPLDLKRRLFKKVPKVGVRERLLLMSQAVPEDGPRGGENRIRAVTFEAGSLPQIVVDTLGHLVLLNDRARSLFRLLGRDIGRPLSDLEISYRPADLRSLIELASTDRRPVVQREVAWAHSAIETSYYDIQVAPVQDEGTLLGVVITFTDVSAIKQLQDELQEANRELGVAYEELQSTNEELETTNEELQSTVEELETTNEELHSTNEELETMNEELQTTNEEMQAVNAEVRRHSAELDEANAFLHSILGGLHSGVAVLDENLLIQVWNGKAEDLWGLRRDEVVGEPLLQLDIGLPTDLLRQPIRDCLAGHAAEQEIVVASRNRRGRAFRCHVTYTPLVGVGGDTRGVILLMEERESADAANGLPRPLPES